MEVKDSQLIKEWIILCKENANKHGFQVVWERKPGPLNPIEKLMKIVSECGEAMEAYVAQTKPNNGKNEIHCDNWKEYFEKEIADIFIRLFHMVGDLEIDLIDVLEKKMKENKLRPILHEKLT